MARTLTFDDLARIHRISNPVPAPDGRVVAITVARVDREGDRMRRRLVAVDVDSGARRVLTPGPGDHHSPAWSPDGRWFAFVSNRGQHGAQIWIMPTGGGEARCVTSGYGGASQLCWAPDSKRIAFARSVVVSPDYAPSAKQRAAVDAKKGPPSGEVFGLKNPKSSARVADELLFRHWDSWRERRRNHVFVVDIDSGRADDVTPGDRDAPPISLGSACDIDFAPDGRELCFVMNPDQVVARSTNLCVYTVRLRGTRAAGEPQNISTSEAADSQPRYSRDGAYIYYLAMQTPRYEADRNRIKRYDRRSGETRTFLARFDRSPSDFSLVEGAALFSADDRGTRAVYRLDLESGRVRQLTSGTTNSAPRPLDPSGARLVVTRQRTTCPAELVLLEPDARGITPELEAGPRRAAADADEPRDAGCRAHTLTNARAAIAGVQMHDAQEIWYRGADRDWVHGFIVPPPNLRKGRRVPLILLIHGGPQGAFGDDFHYRWNAQMFAARGAAVAMLNPRGSTGYGARFKEQISGDWSGRCYRDIMRGVDHITRTVPYVDGTRVAAAGASFGGYMVNWICGHTDRFCALVSHDGVFFSETMAYTTEELWFDEHEHGGLPHERRAGYVASSPHMHVKRFKTPTLVVQGEQDFRCPVSEGLGMFTALQVMGVPSRYLHFPDEGHWVQRPANAEVWYDEVLSWLYRWLEAKRPARKKASTKKKR
ncbi:MAG: S9 family peptidase [Myxococcales bacterium]|nr:S9 family peptidase [Myxococcales bacterium]